MDEKKLLDRIRQSADDLNPPDSLKPEEVRKKIELVEPDRRSYSKFYKLGGLAAALALAVGIGWFAGSHGILSPFHSPQPISQSTAERPASPSETEAAVLPETVPETSRTMDIASADGLMQVSGYEHIYDVLKENFGDTDGTYASGLLRDGYDGGIEEEAAGEVEEAAAETEAAMDTSKESASDKPSDSADYSGDFSQTNIQELGVDEGDTVRTDGAYLYIMNASGQLRIVKADGPSMTLTGTLSIPNLNENTEEMYLDGDTLSIITSGSSSEMLEDSDDVYSIDSKSFIRLYTYDIADRGNPVLKGTVTQEGNFRTSRKAGNYVYMFSEYFPALRESYDTSAFIPEVNGTEMAAEDILLPETLTNSAYLVITSVDTANPGETLDRKAIVSAAGTFYVSTENIYICNTNWAGNTETTQILKFHYQDGTISASGFGEVNGYLNNSFSLNEYQGNLRVLTTQWSGDTTLNHLFILDESMQITGKLTDLAPDETIRSARYMGDTAYFVTFKDTDPLFSADLSDPSNPKLLGALKITGFSSYLHFYGEDKLLGLGNEVDPDTGEYLGIKLSMFDISDPSNVTEIHKYVIKDTYDCPGLYDYKAILADPGKNLLGFECENNYLVFRYEPDQGFVNVFTGALNGQESYEEYGYNARGLYIGDTFYLTDTRSVKSYDMAAGFEEKEKLVF